jgi:hypothetical protein
MHSYQTCCELPFCWNSLGQKNHARVRKLLKVLIINIKVIVNFTLKKKKTYKLILQRGVGNKFLNCIFVLCFIFYVLV